jgi:K+-sensing histidine kinase KdpD
VAGPVLTLAAAMLLAALLVLVAARRTARRDCARQERYRRELFDAELGALARLREAGQVREDLLASVSHEFRTPLTAIRGSAATLAAREDRIAPEDRRALLDGIVEHSERLGRLLEDMLLAASARPAPDSAAVADVSTALAAFRLGQARPPVVPDVEAGLAAYVDPVSLGRVVRALAEHVGADARRDRPVRLRARREGGEVVVDLLYASTGSEEELRRLLEPFSRPDDGWTGRPVSLALYVARRVVEAHGGRVAAGRDGDLLRVRVALRALRPAGGTEPAAGPAGGSDEPEPIPA